MITKRIIPCLDVRNGRVVKGTNFEGIRSDGQWSWSIVRGCNEFLAYQQMQAEASQMAASSQLPEAQEQALDEYPKTY